MPHGCGANHLCHHCAWQHAAPRFRVLGLSRVHDIDFDQAQGKEGEPRQTVETIARHAATPDMWTEEETGQYVMRLRSEFMSSWSTAEAYGRLEEGIGYGMERCPESNRPWLVQFLQVAKKAVPEAIKDNA